MNKKIFILKFEILSNDIKDKIHYKLDNNLFLKIIKKKDVLDELYYKLGKLPTEEDII